MAEKCTKTYLKMPLKFDEKFVVEYTKNGCRDISQEVKSRCKVFKFTSEWNFNELLVNISDLNPIHFPKLYFFIFEWQFGDLTNGKPEKLVILENFLLKFGKNRPMVLKLVSKDEEVTKFYYNEKKSSEFLEIDLQTDELDNFHDFPTFLLIFINVQNRSLENQVIEKLKMIRNSSLILRFLRTLRCSREFINRMIQKCAVNGSKNDFLAALDSSLEDDGRILSIEAQEYLSSLCEVPEYSESSSECSETSSEESGTDSDDDSSNKSSIHAKETSILLLAVQNSNSQVFDYLTSHCTHLIQQLPFDHQVEISSTAFATKEFDFLSDLLEISDFPFPKKFPSRISHSRLKKITDKREKFHDAIEGGKLDKISKYIDDNMSLRIAFNAENESALNRALESDQYELFFHLMSLGFRATEFENYEHFVSGRVLRKMRKFARDQTKKNANNALANEEKSIQLLSARSFIHNRKISKQIEAEYRNKIKSWYRSIYHTKHGSKLLNAASQCDKLRMIFDFESDLVKNADLEAQGSLATTYTDHKWIFIGAKTSDLQCREQTIKGVIAHEICHYVLKMVYENNESPYYAGDEESSKQFNDIVAEYRQWNYGDFYSEESKLDDECNGIVSIVYKGHEAKDHHAELIVRVPNILAEFDNDDKKVEYLENKYNLIFDYYYKIVVKELEKFNLKFFEIVKNLNKIGEVLSEIRESQYELLKPMDMKNLIESKCVVILTNIPKLLLLNIHNYLHCNVKNLLDANNIFITSENLQKPFIFDELKEVLDKNSDIKIIIDCTKGVPDYLKDILSIKDCNFVFIVTNEDGCMKLAKICEDEKVEVPIKQKMNFNWNDLKMESQKLLLETKISFQNISQIKLLDLLENKKAAEPKEEDFGDLSEIIDDKLLNFLLDKQEIKINQMFEKDEAEKYFELLFRPRRFVRKKEGIRIPQDWLLSDIQGKQYVLLSDIAGTGKSWVMKNLASLFREQNPTRWVTYVNLKQFIEELKELEENSEFSKFMIEKVLKPQNKFEEELFKKLYKSGKTCIFFDGFDEIAPDCAEFVATLAKAFEFNDGNQLWIATRDFFEINLKQRLQIDDVYGLAEFSEEEGIDFIVSSWVLADLKKNNENISKNDFERILKSSPDLENYRHKAQEIVRKVATSQNRSVGSPQLFKMIADSFKDSENITQDLKGLKIYGNFAQKHYERWSYEKGQLRKEANLKSQENDFNFWKFHQYCAIKSLFPELVDFLFPDYDDSEWKEEEIIACGLMSKKGGKFYFLHETFREFFVADYIAKALKKHKIDEKTFEIFITILTVKKFEVIRMFLNDAIDESILENIQPKMPNFITKFHKKETFSEFFTENLEHLANLFIKLFKSADYEDKQEIIYASTGDVVVKTKEQKMFLKFQEFMFEALEVNDLKDIIHEHRMFHKVLESRLEIEAFEGFVTETLKRTDREFFRHELTLVDSESNRNILHNLVLSQNFCTHKAQICFEIIQDFLTVTEIFELIENCDKSGQNILQICIKEEKKEKFEILWLQIQNFYSSQQLFDKFKELLKQKDSDDDNLLHFASECKDFEYFKIFWELLLKTFGSAEELKNLILQENKFGNNFIHRLVVNNQPKIIEFAFKSLKENLDESQYKEILRARGEYKRNLLLLAAWFIKQAETFEMLWNEVKYSCKSNEEFFEILNEVDEENNNAFHFSACFTTGEIFEFMVAEFAKIATKDEIRKLLKNLNEWKRNLLQQAAYGNKSLEIHKVLWKIIKKYFNSSEILEFINHFDKYGDNFLCYAVYFNIKEIVDFTWKEVKKVLNYNNCEDEELNKNIEKCDEIIKKARQSIELKDEEKEFLKLKWIKAENPKLFDDDAQLIIEGKLNVRSLNDLMRFMTDENVKNHEILWTHLLKIYKTREELKNLLTEKDGNGDNFIHLLVICNIADVIEFTFGKLNENFTDSQYQEILRSKGFKGKNLLQNAGVNSKEVKTHQILWKVFEYSCKANEEFLEILNEVDENGSNAFNSAASSTTGEIFEFMEAELAKIASQDDIRKMLKNLNKDKQNLFQSAAFQNKSLELHEVLWKIIKKYFNSSEVLEFIKHLSIYGNNLLITLTEENSKDIREFTWREVKKVLKSSNCGDEELNKKVERCDEIIKKARQSVQLNYEEEEFLKLKWIKIENPKIFDDYAQRILEENLNVRSLNDLMRFMTDENFENHKILWNHLPKIYKNNSELKNLLTEKDKYGDNFIHLLVAFNKAGVIEFTFEKLKENLNESQYQEILRSKGESGRNLLQHAACTSKKIKTHQILWNIFQNSCKSNEEFFIILKEVDGENNDVFHLAACFTTGEIFKFMATELRKLASFKETKEILSSLGHFNKNLLQSLVIQNKQLKTHKMVWKIICKYFEAAEILKFIHHFDKFGDNLLCNAVEWNTKEIVEFTWNQIKIFIISKDGQVEYLRKNISENKSKDQEVKLWVQNVLQKYEITF